MAKPCGCAKTNQQREAEVANNAQAREKYLQGLTSDRKRTTKRTERAARRVRTA